MKTVLILFLMFLTVLAFSQDLILTNQENLDVYIEIPGGMNIHKFALKITVTGTTTLETACNITYPGGSKTSFSTNNSGLVVNGSSLDYKISTTGALAAGIATYTMNVIVQPDNGGDASNNGVISADETWKFQLFTLTTPNTIEITARDFENKYGSIPVNDTIDLPPTAVITSPAGSSVTQTPTTPVNFEGDGDDDRVGFTHNWTHTISSTTTSFSIIENPPLLTLPTIGTYDIEYIVTDSNNQIAKDTFQVIVEAGNSPPTAALSSPALVFGRSPLGINFNGTPSNDPDGNLEYYNWTFGDGETESTSVPTITHNYFTGAYTAELETKDDQGLTSDPVATKHIYVASNEIIDFSKHIGPPLVWLSPDIDGAVTGDNGWEEASKVIHSGGTTVDMVFQGIQDKSEDFLYHSFQVYDEDGMGDPDDLIVLGYRGDQTLSESLVPLDTDRLLFIYPFKPNVSNSTPYTVKIYQHNSTDWIKIADSLLGFELGADNGTTDQWTVELKIPTDVQSTVWNTLNDNFLFTYYVFNTIGAKIVFKRHWPRDVEDVTGYAAVPSGDNFSPFWWGLAGKESHSPSGLINIRIK